MYDVQKEVQIVACVKRLKRKADHHRKAIYYGTLQEMLQNTAQKLCRTRMK